MCGILQHNSVKYHEQGQLCRLKMCLPFYGQGSQAYTCSNKCCFPHLPSVFFSTTLYRPKSRLCSRYHYVDTEVSGFRQISQTSMQGSDSKTKSYNSVKKKKTFYILTAVHFEINYYARKSK